MYKHYRIGLEPDGIMIIAVVFCGQKIQNAFLRSQVQIRDNYAIFWCIFDCVFPHFRFYFASFPLKKAIFLTTLIFTHQKQVFARNGHKNNDFSCLLIDLFNPSLRWHVGEILTYHQTSTFVHIFDDFHMTDKCWNIFLTFICLHF